MIGSLGLRNYGRVHMRSVRAPGWRAARFFCPPNTDPVRRSAFPDLCDLVPRKSIQDLQCELTQACLCAVRCVMEIVRFSFNTGSYELQRMLMP